MLATRSQIPRPSSRRRPGSSFSPSPSGRGWRAAPGAGARCAQHSCSSSRRKPGSIKVVIPDKPAKRARSGTQFLFVVRNILATIPLASAANVPLLALPKSGQKARRRRRWSRQPPVVSTPLPLAYRAPVRTRASLPSNMRALLARSPARLRHRQRRRLSLQIRHSQAATENTQKLAQLVVLSTTAPCFLC